MSTSVALDKLTAAVATCGKPWPAGKYAFGQLKAEIDGKDTSFFRLYTILPDDVDEISAATGDAWWTYFKLPVLRLGAEQLGLAMDQAVTYLADSADPAYKFLAEGGVRRANHSLYFFPRASDFPFFPAPRETDSAPPPPPPPDPSPPQIDRKPLTDGGVCLIDGCEYVVARCKNKPILSVTMRDASKKTVRECPGLHISMACRIVVKCNKDTGEREFLLTIVEAAETRHGRRLPKVNRPLFEINLGGAIACNVRLFFSCRPRPPARGSPSLPSWGRRLPNVRRALTSVWDIWEVFFAVTIAFFSMSLPSPLGGPHGRSPLSPGTATPTTWGSSTKQPGTRQR